MNNKINKNWGLDIEREEQEQSEKDWMFGAVDVQDLAIIPEHERQHYLPLGEVQKSDLEDMMDCASRGILNIVEAKLNYLLKTKKLSFSNEVWLKQNGYVTDFGVELSDAFISIKSGTTRRGNSLKAPLEAVRKLGCVPKSKLPLEKWMTWEQYHDPNRITLELDAVGLEFEKRIKINYIKVESEHFAKSVQEDFLDVAGYAWPQHSNGIYPPVPYPPNHVFVLYKQLFMAFDNYIDPFDGDFMKNLAHNYNFYSHGYRMTVNQEIVVPKPKGYWNSIKRYFGTLIK